MIKSKQTAVRLTPEAKTLLFELAKKLGVTRTAIVEMAIREFSQKRTVSVWEGKGNE